MNDMHTNKRKGTAMRSLIQTLVGGIAVATAAASLSAPPASAETRPAPAVETAEQLSVPNRTPMGDDTCEGEGGKSDNDRDCLTIRLVSETAYQKTGRAKQIGEKDIVRGKVHSSLASELGPNTRVIIERAADGDMWSDDGEKWRKVAKVKVRDNGTFKATVLLHRHGVHTFRARLVEQKSKKPSARTAATAAASVVRPADMSTFGSVQSDTTQTAVGAPFYYFEIYNKAGHQLNASCAAVKVGAATPSNFANYQPITETQPVRCAFPIIPDEKGSNTIGATISLQQADPYIGDGSIYHFNPDNTKYGKACANINPRIAPGDIIRIDVTKADFWTNWNMGYSGTKNFPSDPEHPMCDFLMNTTLQEDLWTEAPWWVIALEVVGAIIVLLVATLVLPEAIAAWAGWTSGIEVFEMFMLGTGISAGTGIFLAAQADSAGSNDNCDTSYPVCQGPDGIQYGKVTIPQS